MSAAGQVCAKPLDVLQHHCVVCNKGGWCSTILSPHYTEADRWMKVYLVNPVRQLGRMRYCRIERDLMDMVFYW